MQKLLLCQKTLTEIIIENIGQHWKMKPVRVYLAIDIKKIELSPFVLMFCTDRGSSQNGTFMTSSTTMKCPIMICIPGKIQPYSYSFG